MKTYNLFLALALGLLSGCENGSQVAAMSSPQAVFTKKAKSNLYLYAACDSVIVTDVSDISNPKRLSSIAGDIGNVTYVATYQGFVYLVTDEGYTKVVDISNPRTPIETDVLGYFPDAPIKNLQIVGNRLVAKFFFGDVSRDKGLAYWDLSDPAHPKQITQVEYDPSPCKGF